MAPKVDKKKEMRTALWVAKKALHDQTIAKLVAKEESDAIRSRFTRSGTSILRNDQQPLWLGRHNIESAGCIDNALRQAFCEMDRYLSNDDQLHMRDIFYKLLVIVIPYFIRDP